MSRRPLAELKTLSEVLQEAFKCDSLRDAIGFVCMWEEYRRSETGTLSGEPCYGHVVSELLKLNGVDVDKLGRMN